MTAVVVSSRLNWEGEGAEGTLDGAGDDDYYSRLRVRRNSGQNMSALRERICSRCDGARVPVPFGESDPTLRRVRAYSVRGAAKASASLMPSVLGPSSLVPRPSRKQQAASRLDAQPSKQAP